MNPIDVGMRALDRAEALLGAATHIEGILRLKNDVRRMALVMGVAGVDAYLHARVLRHASKLRVAANIPESWKKIDISIADLAAMARSVVAARKRGTDSRPWGDVRNALHARMLKMTFQSPDEIGQALALCNVKSAWPKIGTIAHADPAQLRTRLSTIVFRRNRIVHETDLVRLVRPRHMKLSIVKVVEIRDDLVFLRMLVNAIDLVTT